MQSQRTTFQQAFMSERARYQVSRAQIAQHVGVGVPVIKRWERGEAIPSIQQFKRIITRLPRVAPYAPDWGVFAEAAMDGRLEEKREDLARDIERMKERNEFEPKPPAQDFGSGLKRCREENEVTLDELGELLSITGQAISQWENDNVCPVEINLQKLYDVLPELKAGIDTGAIRRPESRDIPVPVGNRFPRAATLDTALQMAMEQSDEEAARQRIPKPKTSASEWAVDVSIDVEGKHHEHVFKSNARLGGASTREVCVICGVPKPASNTVTEIRRVPHEHILKTERCPCGGEVGWSPDPITPGDTNRGVWVCASCLRRMRYDELVAASPVVQKVSTLGELAQDYALARQRLLRARIAETNAAIIHRDAEAELRVAEQAEREALQLLDLAAEEST